MLLLLQQHFLSLLQLGQFGLKILLELGGAHRVTLLLLQQLRLQKRALLPNLLNGLLRRLCLPLQLLISLRHLLEFLLQIGVDFAEQTLLKVLLKFLSRRQLF